MRPCATEGMQSSDPLHFNREAPAARADSIVKRIAKENDRAAIEKGRAEQLPRASKMFRKSTRTGHGMRVASVQDTCTQLLPFCDDGDRVSRGFIDIYAKFTFYSASGH